MMMSLSRNGKPSHFVLRERDVTQNKIVEEKQKRDARRVPVHVMIVDVTLFDWHNDILCDLCFRHLFCVQRTVC